MIKSANRFFWTSGRKCNFKGCDREDLKPVIVKGWFWSGSGVRLGNYDFRIFFLNLLQFLQESEILVRVQSTHFFILYKIWVHVKWPTKI